MGNWSCGVSNYAHKYWPLLFQISRSENEEAAQELLRVAIKFVEDCDDAQVTIILADGGKAILAAISQISQDRTEKLSEEFKLWLRRCFAHVIRMGMTQGGGKRGGKGVLP